MIRFVPLFVVCKRSAPNIASTSYSTGSKGLKYITSSGFKCYEQYRKSKPCDCYKMAEERTASTWSVTSVGPFVNCRSP